MTVATEVNITINGQSLTAQAGQTVMEAAEQAGIEIPKLCHHSAVKPYGGCRVCLVDIENQRTLQPACTFPVAEGMVVQTENDKISEARKFALNMLFSERQHYCMYCAMSGPEDQTDCELQALAYKYGLTHWDYPPNYDKDWPVDATRHDFIMDHSRCILCRRCIRICSEVVGNHTLGAQDRGAETMICADYDVPFGESTCVSCGTCLQVCPTGALFDRRSAYMPHDADMTRTKTACLGCAVGCDIETLVSDNHLLRIDGDFEGMNKGVLCSNGRFDAVDTPDYPRVNVPLIRKEGKLVETDWDTAVDYAARGLNGAQQVAGLVSSRLPNEAMQALFNVVTDLFGSKEVGLLNGDLPPLDLGTRAQISDLDAADCVVVVGGNPLENQKVLGYAVKRAFHRGAKLIVANDTPSDLDLLADIHLEVDSLRVSEPNAFDSTSRSFYWQMQWLEQVGEAVKAAENPVILYGSGLGDAVYAELRALTNAKFLPLVRGANAMGALRIGITKQEVKGDAVYILAADDQPTDNIPDADFVVVQAVYQNGWTKRADVVFPCRPWQQWRGHVVNLEGRTLELTRSEQPAENTYTNAAVLDRLSAKVRK